MDKEEEEQEREDAVVERLLDAVLLEFPFIHSYNGEEEQY